MSLKNSKSQTEILEISRIALQNVENNTVIKPLMEALGYNTAKVDEGKALLALAKNKYNANHTLEDNKLKAYKEFEDFRLKIQTEYAKDRKKAKIIFKNEPLTLKELHLKGAQASTYVKWTEVVSIFYNLINTDANIQAKLLPLQVTPAHVTAVLANLDTLAVLRGNYIETIGMAQNATKTKNTEFSTLDNWMSDFFGIARIALAEEPQLLESLGKQVRS